jgi:formate-dependent nitrite reductase membrane component NrfD
MTMKTGERVRYADTIDPVTTDWRDVDTAIATLDGEGAQQRANSDDEHLKRLAPAPWDRVPAITDADTTYYDRPLLKPSVWSVDIPIYYFLGGTAGAALTLGASIQLLSTPGKHPMPRLSELCHWTGIIGSTAGAAFLIHDLGRPSRFLYMMRVFRPTSPMNMGAWILGGAAPTAIATGLFINRRGPLGLLGEAAGYASGLFGAALAGYTGVLVSNSAIPLWQEARRWVPVMFVASSGSAAASIIAMFSNDERSCRAIRIFGTAARIVEIAATKQVERAASAIPKVAEPLRRGGPAILWKAATGLTVASLAFSLSPIRGRKKTIAAGLLGAAGSLCLRFAVHYLSNASARDPRASFHQQRARTAEQTRLQEHDYAG